MARGVKSADIDHPLFHDYRGAFFSYNKRRDQKNKPKVSFERYLQVRGIMGPRAEENKMDARTLEQLEAEVERLKAMTYLPSNEAIDKAAKYDALRERFPFLPGEEFWSFFQGSICKWTVDKIWFNFDDNLCLIGYRERPGNTALESPKYLASECYHTADACRAAIPVEE